MILAYIEQRAVLVNLIFSFDRRPYRSPLTLLSPLDCSFVAQSEYRLVFGHLGVYVARVMIIDLLLIVRVFGRAEECS